MLTIDDNATVQTLLRRCLTRAGYEVKSAQDGHSGIRLAQEEPPDVVICDIKMPGCDGFGVLAALRSDERTCEIPVIFISVLDDKESMLEALRQGASDYLIKPFKPEALVTSIKNTMIRRNSHRVDHRKTIPPGSMRLDESSLGMLTSKIETALTKGVAVTGTVPRETKHAAVLIADIRRFTAFSEILKPEEIAELLRAFFTQACGPILQQEGWIAKFMGDGLLAMFESERGSPPDHAERALRAALLMVLAAHRFKEWIGQRFQNVQLPEFAIGVGVQIGTIAICDVTPEDTDSPAIIGDTVNVAARLEAMTKEVGSSILAGEEVSRAAGRRFEIGRSATVTVRGRSTPVKVVEITGLAPRDDSPGTSRELYRDIREAVVANSAIVNAAATLELEDPGIAGYQVAGKIAEGGMSKIYLARADHGGEQCVLKVITISEDDEGEEIQRFIQEYALISKIHHTNVAQIYSQGFTEKFAYIAMEYFPGGDLKERIRAGISPKEARNYLAQAAAALSAVHAAGIIHRDLKPANMMLRADGTLALVDFGISKHSTMDLTRTAVGRLYGTPTYMSPEHIQGLEVDARTDLYSLGVMFFEMLTGSKPYQSSDYEDLVRMHVQAEIPQLPAAAARYQPIVDYLMAKNLDSRCSSAVELLNVISVF